MSDTSVRVIQVVCSFCSPKPHCAVHSVTCRVGVTGAAVHRGLDPGVFGSRCGVWEWQVLPGEAGYCCAGE